MTVWQFILVGFLCCVGSTLSIPPEKKAFKPENPEGGNPRGLTLTTDQNTVGKSSSRFFGGMTPSYVNPNSGFFPSPLGGYNMGGFPTNPYPSPYGYMNGPPMNYGGFYQPFNPGFYGNSFGGYASTQQQQQTSQIGTGGAGMGGFQPPFGG